VQCCVIIIDGLSCIVYLLFSKVIAKRCHEYGKKHTIRCDTLSCRSWGLHVSVDIPIESNYRNNSINSILAVYL
jgi:hypothetical protein